MLRSITATQFRNWVAYSELEPFDERRQDLRNAHIVQTLTNMWRDTKKYPRGFPLEDFVLNFGGEAKPRKTLDDMKKILMQIAYAHSAPTKKKGNDRT